MNANEWSSVSSVLKRIITSDRILIEAKNQNSFEADNINNYMLLSNNDAIKMMTEGDIILLMFHQRMKATLTNLNKTCFNDLTGHAFYCYLIEIDLLNIILKIFL